ncbi:hypothetical protein [Streptomyces sp. NPDC056061]|uniref:hypothetical protein n=1 Tax=Streptomyces sp. NPDC056061 TaxID=3345700 RepID=UPI0035DF9003
MTLSDRVTYGQLPPSAALLIGIARVLADAAARVSPMPGAVPRLRRGLRAPLSVPRI